MKGRKLEEGELEGKKTKTQEDERERESSYRCIAEVGRQIPAGSIKSSE